jgi:hypothetical protein
VQVQLIPSKLGGVTKMKDVHALLKEALKQNILSFLNGECTETEFEQNLINSTQAVMEKYFAEQKIHIKLNSAFFDDLPIGFRELDKKFAKASVNIAINDLIGSHNIAGEINMLANDVIKSNRQGKSIGEKYEAVGFAIKEAIDRAAPKILATFAELLNSCASFLIASTTKNIEASKALDLLKEAGVELNTTREAIDKAKGPIDLQRIYNDRMAEKEVARALESASPKLQATVEALINCSDKIKSLIPTKSI